MSFIPLYFALPLISAFLIPIIGKIYKPLVWIWSTIVSFILFILALYGITVSQQVPMLVYKMGNWPPPFGIVMAFDGLSALMVLSIAVIVFAACFFSIKYMSHYTGQWKFYTLLMLMTTGMMGIAVTGDLFNMFVFLEIAAISSYALVAFGVDAEELEASFKYIVMGEIGGLTFLLAIALIYAKTSTLNLADISNSLQAIRGTTFFWTVLTLFLFAFSIKAALVPFHSWLPDAHPAAPAPISSLLSGIFIKVLGIYTTARIVFNVFGLTRASDPVFFNILIALGLLSIAFAGLTALNQRDYKRLLGFSSISQIGYIMLGFGIGNFYGIAGALFFILAHALAKGLLFLTSGAVVYSAGTRDLEKLAGLGEQMPTTAWSWRFGFLSLAGIPPLAGFFAKMFIIMGAIKAGYLWLAIVGILLSLLTLGYLLKIENFVFMKKGKNKVGKAPFSMRIAMVFLVVLILLVGIGFQPIMDFVVGPAAQALLRGIEYSHMVFGFIAASF
ncbi:MAG TPA: NADH/ubiquinone/plastoquinone (complex I) [candidate division WOR-3 bacterium]|uniref:NADH/ubiquinone/plastoquinone (Complex I) n=1 Tax=candidate division WOR-3 bacterium TaxID=2052148 RepID=A0A9C9JZ56_UNCW3|nr:NADH/ubiquinone/plastoquinone (complex I) [candidate division WOR-3 bacterium]